MKINKYLKRIVVCLSVFILVLLAVQILQYTICPVYDFLQKKPFSGRSWHNPYQILEGNWYKANFHAHSRAWFGITAGIDESTELYEHYKKMGYDVIGLSNYQTVYRGKNDSIDFFPAYEHGYNVRKRHHLAIGAKQVVWRDYLFWQNIHHKQHLLKILRHKTPFLVINHPMLMDAFTEEDFERLTDYDAIEVLNHYRNSKELWDAALSAGRLIWIIGNDDTHNISDPGQTGVCWTMVNALSNRQDEIISALRAGRMYGVEGRGGLNQNQLEKMEIKGDSLFLELEQSAREISFICDRGKIFRTFSDTKKARILPDSHHTYVRIEIQNENSRMYLNPVVRFNGQSIPSYSATIDVTRTWLQRVLSMVILVMILTVSLGIRRVAQRKC